MRIYPARPVPLAHFFERGNWRQESLVDEIKAALSHHFGINTNTSCTTIHCCSSYRRGHCRANIPQSEYSAAIRDHRHAITLAGIVKDGIWPGHNLVRGLGNPGGQVKRTEDEMIMLS